LILIGRFPIYTDFDVSELSDYRKWEYILGLISKFSVSLANFIEITPEPVLRLIGPFKAKKSKSYIILSSPVSMIFKILLSELPKITSCSTSPKSRFVEMTTLDDLYDIPGEYKIEFEYPIIDFEFLKYYFRKFIGLELQINFEFLAIKRKNNKNTLQIKTLNSDTTAAVKFLRYLCLGDKYNYSDVKIKRVANNE
jgi:hypothetical protein